MRVKTSDISNLYVLITYRPRSTKRIASLRVSRKPFRSITAGGVVRVQGVRLRVTAVTTRVEQREEITEHVTELFTAATRKRMPSNVVRMPTGDDTDVTQFLRYHVLIRVYHGDPDAWLAQLQARGRADDGGDLRFVRWIRSRLRQDPGLLAAIRRMVDATPFWRVAEG
jgi:sorbitol-specific phosphotransferase system component IIA